MPGRTEIIRFIAAFLAVAVLAACEDKQAESAAAESSPTAETSDEAPAPSNEKSEPQADRPDCEQAYEDLKALVAGLEEQLGSSDSELPERGEFLESCGSLPPEIQKCMVFEYAMAHQTECEERVNALDAAQREKARELMGK